MHLRAALMVFLLGGSGSVVMAQPPEIPPPGTMPASPAEIMPVEQIIPALVEALKDSDSEVRQQLGIALANTGEKAVPALILVLRDVNRDKRSAAAYALGQIGPPAKGALPYLLVALKDEDVLVRRQVAYAIARLTAPERPPILNPMSASPFLAPPAPASKVMP